MSEEATEAPAAFVKRATGPKKLTWSALSRKPRRTAEITVSISGDEYVGAIQALSPAEYDALVAQYPPTKEQRDKGEVLDEDRFALALIAACFTQPELSLEQVTTLRENGAWATGEIRELYRRCLEINHAGVSIPFTGAG